jgi:hypothetical protein
MVEQADYFSYVLRLWQAREDGETSWRASLQVVPEGERLGFASLEELFAYLRQQTRNAEAPLSEEQGPS